MRNDLARCRAGLSKMLIEAIARTYKLEQRLGVTDDWYESIGEVDLKTDSTAQISIPVALLLRKARIHTDAVVRANKTNNLHSLAVQMRPVLECAGQVLYFFFNSIIAPEILNSRESAVAKIGEWLNADFYQTFLRQTRGRISSEELREMATKAQSAAADAFGMENPKKQESWRITQANKIEILADGCEWYNCLSKYFCHAKTVDLRKLSWNCVVFSKDKVKEQLAFLFCMHYLLEQVAQMNAAAALCPVAGEAGDQRGQWVESALDHQRHLRESSNTLWTAAISGLTRGRDGDVRTA